MTVDQPHYKTSDEVDFCHRGSGAAGGILAKELSTNGFSRGCLGAGPLPDGSRFYPQRKSKSWPRTSSPTIRNFKPNTFRKTPDEKAKPQRALVYGRCVGGTSVHFTANFWRFHENRFHRAQHKSARLPAPGLMDWPITYADLEPFYTKVEWEIGVSGLAGASPFDPRGRSLIQCRRCR